jgi:intracellular sulfur oxidation DsrE/DsrF family protein
MIQITLTRGAAMVLASVVCATTPALAQSRAATPIPGYEGARPVPGAHELPDPALVYKVVFDVAKAADKVDDVNPGLLGAVRYFNTLAAHGVPADHIKVAVVIHQDATPLILSHEAFKARNDGHDNPNIALIQAMKKAGIDLRVCGQSVLGKKIDPKTIQPEIELDLWALVTMTNLELRGYVHVGG